MKGLRKTTENSRVTSLIAVFAALNVVCDSIVGLPWLSSGVWYGWIFIIEPITGIILGPQAGFLSVLIGVMIGHSIYFRGFEEFLFTIGAPIGAMISGLLFRGNWKIALVYYLALLSAYFATPISWQLPLWGMWDVYVAFAALLLVSFLINAKREWWDASSSVRILYILALSSFIGLEADVLFRIFILIPCRTYSFIYGLSAEALYSIWVLGALETPVKVSLSTLITTIIGSPLLTVLRKAGLKIRKD